jgi:hypothetical protein
MDVDVTSPSGDRRLPTTPLLGNDDTNSTTTTAAIPLAISEAIILSSLLDNLVQIRITLSNNSSSSSPPKRQPEHPFPSLPLDVHMWALPEQDFHTLTSRREEGSGDGTGMRPYSGAVAFLQFVRAFPNVFGNSTSSSVDLGAGIGACGLLLAKMQSQATAEQKLESTSSSLLDNWDHARRPRIVVTDGEELAVETIKRNRELFGLGPDDVQVCKLLWSDDPKQIAKQLDDDHRSSSSSNCSTSLYSVDETKIPRFTYVIGTDLLYYRSDARVLLATAVALLDTSIVDGDGAIFLPAIIRSANLADDLVKAAHDFGFEASTSRLRSFVPKADLQLISGWYNLDFLILTRKGATLQPALKCAMESCKQRLFVPGASSSEEEEDGDDNA